MRVERDDYRGQLRRRETDFENRTKAEHSNTVRQLESRLETDDIASTKAKEAEARSTAEADRLRHELASKRITHEGELRERERAATSKFNIAMGTKDRMILKRESKIEEANVKTLEAIEDNERVERELEWAYAKNTARLTFLGSGGGGAPPRAACREDPCIKVRRAWRAHPSALGPIGE